MAAPARLLGPVFSNVLSNIQRSKYFKFHFLVQYQCRLCSKSTSSTGSIDPGTISIQPRVQEILHQITGIDAEKLHRTKQIPRGKPAYGLLTDEQLAQREKAVRKKAARKLQSPPIMKPREPIDEIMASDPDLCGQETSKYVFTDITYGLPETSRFIVVREPDGTLRKASWEERERMYEVYYHKPGRRMKAPKMIESPQLEILLQENRFEYILDRACIQFEPDDPVFINICKQTYDAVNGAKHHDDLRSTRHFAGLAFHLTVEKNVDNLLIDMIQRDLIEDVLAIMNLYHIIHPECVSANDPQLLPENSSVVERIKMFAMKECSEGHRVELAIQSYEDAANEMYRN